MPANILNVRGFFDNLSNNFMNYVHFACIWIGLVYNMCPFDQNLLISNQLSGGVSTQPRKIRAVRLADICLLQEDCKEEEDIQGRSGRSIQDAAHIILDAKEEDDLQAVHRRCVCEMNVSIIITVRTLICVKLVEGDPRFVTAEWF